MAEDGHVEATSGTKKRRYGTGYAASVVDGRPSAPPGISRCRRAASPELGLPAPFRRTAHPSAAWRTHGSRSAIRVL
jgi:hypothetical protein